RLCTAERRQQPVSKEAVREEK
ncbi:hypothetical protein A2U01_0043551, partial [Trifolium medium]|nr:hypothetical protein [Trifolium medium]